MKDAQIPLKLEIAENRKESLYDAAIMHVHSIADKEMFLDVAVEEFFNTKRTLPIPENLLFSLRRSNIRFICLLVKPIYLGAYRKRYIFNYALRGEHVLLVQSIEKQGSTEASPVQSDIEMTIKDILNHQRQLIYPKDILNMLRRREKINLEPNLVLFLPQEGYIGPRVNI